MTNLLLFETCIVDSVGLRELPRLIELVDYSGLMRLIKGGALRFQPFRAIAADIDGVAVRSAFTGSESYRRLANYRISVGRVIEKRGEEASKRANDDPEASVNDDIEEFLRAVDSLSSVGSKRRGHLRDAMRSATIAPPPDLWSDATTQTHLDIDAGAYGLTEAVSRCLGKATGDDLPARNIRLRIHRESDIEVVVESNLTNMGLPPAQAHIVVGNALLALGRLNVRLSFMKSQDCIAGIREDEAPFIQEKLKGLMRDEFGVKQEAFSRVVTVSDLPDMAAAIEMGALDVDRLLDIRDSSVCREFRQWLQMWNGENEHEMVERIMSIKARLGGVSGSPAGRVIKLALIAGAGTVSGVVAGTTAGASAALGFGLLDEFLVKKLLTHSGPTAFLDRLYPSIFLK